MSVLLPPQSTFPKGNKIRLGKYHRSRDGKDLNTEVCEHGWGVVRVMNFGTAGAFGSFRSCELLAPSWFLISTFVPLHFVGWEVDFACVTTVPLES